MSLQARVRRQLREDVLDAAYHVLAEEGWSAVRMTSLAAAVGVSRQTLYKEFASKEDIGRALVLREAERFALRFQALAEDAPSASAFLETVIRLAYEHGSANRVLIAVLTETPRHEGDSLLPFVTTDAAEVFTLAAGFLARTFLSRVPDLDPEDVAATGEALSRLLVSHLLQPTTDPETTIARLVRLAHRSLGLPLPGR